MQCSYAGAETRGVEGVDGEDAVAALRTAGAADQVRAGAAGGLREGGIDDLDKLGVAEREHGGMILRWRVSRLAS